MLVSYRFQPLASRLVVRRPSTSLPLSLSLLRLQLRLSLFPYSYRIRPHLGVVRPTHLSREHIVRFVLDDLQVGLLDKASHALLLLAQVLNGLRVVALVGRRAEQKLLLFSRFH